VTVDSADRSAGDERRSASAITPQTTPRELARAITLVESTRSEDRVAAGELLESLLPDTGNAIRVGISGAPGVGKSTFIEALGLHIVAQGLRLAVLAVDPSSTRSGGSILGDKTRMDRLTREPNAYIRPSPSGGAIGGVARRTREALLVCEAAGFDVVIVETVGVGQSEVEVDHVVDVFVLLANPAGGDELQGIKRGVMELVDVLAVTKADGDLLPAARQAAADYIRALHFLRPKHAGVSAEVVLTSAVTGDGIAETWSTITDFHTTLANSGALAQHRADQSVAWLWSEVRGSMLDWMRSADGATDIERAVANGELFPPSAAERLLAMLRSGTGPGADSEA
jgi:LAO/AO transport system kinase